VIDSAIGVQGRTKATMSNLYQGRENGHVFRVTRSRWPEMMSQGLMDRDVDTQSPDLNGLKGNLFVHYPQAQIETPVPTST